MVITFSVGGTANGPRPIDPNRDFPQLAQLLKTVFFNELESGGQRIFESVAASGKPPVLWRLDPFFSRLTPGFVWEEDGHIVGNVTLLPTRLPKRFVVANVAIDANYRRRGIARALMEVAQKATLKRGGNEIRLQVAKDNEGARDLYKSLGYSTLGTVTTWNLLGSRNRLPNIEPLPAENRIEVCELPRARWQDAYQLDLATPQADLYWPEPLARDEYRRNLKRRISDFLSGRRFEIWMVADGSGSLQGMATINSEWGRVHQLRIRVRSDRQGNLEAALLHRLLQRLQFLPRRQVRLFHDADDDVMNELLPALRFRPDRILTQMRLTLK